MKKTFLEWTVGHCNGLEARPSEFVPARVPGAVQLDWAKAHDWPEYTYGDNWKAYGWMEDVFWVYQAKLVAASLGPAERLFFVCLGIDYRFQVRLGGKIVHEQEGMFTPFELDLTEATGAGGLLEIVVFPAPKTHAEPADRSQADQSCKPAVSYGWDWHPRLVPLGIWDETYCEVRPALHLSQAETSYTLTEDFSAAALTVTARVSPAGPGRLHWRLLDDVGVSMCEAEAAVSGAETIILTANLATPRLWWPSGEGRPTLYTSQVELLDGTGASLQTLEQRVGFRRVKLIMHPGAWDEPSGFPKTRSTPPITLEINGRAIFCRGTNWVNPEIFPGIITEDTYKPLLTLARDAHMNLLRIWGGGIVNKESFFELCDELGLMVWQEFPLACNNYEGTPTYLATLDTESRSIIKRLRLHPSLALWCGGNELFNGWSGMTEQSLALRLLNRNCYELDQATPFLMTAPLMGMAHGNYLFRYADGREVFQVLPLSNATAYTEFGCPGPSPADYLRGFIPPEDLFPPSPGTAWETHHAFGAWVGDTWLQPGLLEDYFGPSADLETLVSRGEWLQCEGYKCLFEEARRQKPVCSMALNWCYNEPWPSAANNSLINWPAQPKPAYYAVAAACRPTLASARIPRFSWTEGDWFSPELWLLHDGPAPLPSGRLEVYLRLDDEETFLLGWDYPASPANTHQPGPILKHRLPRSSADRMTLLLRVPAHPEWNSEYHLQYHPLSQPKTKTATLNI